MSHLPSPTTPGGSSWLRTTPNGLRANKTSRSVLATINESQTAALAVAPGGQARATLSACFTSTFGRSCATPVDCMAAPACDDGLDAAYSPLSPASRSSLTIRRQTSQVLPDDVDSEDNDDVGVFGFRAVPRDEPVSAPGRIADGARPSSPPSSRHTPADDSQAQIVTARPFRIHTARARSHSIEVIRGMQLLSPESPSHPFSHPYCPPFELASAPLTPSPSPRPCHSRRYSPSAPGTPRLSASPLLPPLRPVSPLLVSTSSSPAPSASPSPSPRTPASAPPTRRRIPRASAIAKDYAALLEHIHEDENESQGTSGLGSRTTRSASVPSVPAQRSLPPPPRPRNRALVRPAPHPFASPSVCLPPDNPNLSRLASLSPSFTPRSTPVSALRRISSEQALGPPPALAPAPHLHHFIAQPRTDSVPPTPTATPLSPSSAYRFPQSPHSSFPSTPHASRPSSPRSPTYRSSFLPSCGSTRDSVTIKDRSRVDSIDFSHRASSLSFGDFNLPYSPQRASGFSFWSTASGRSATEAESIPIDLHDRPAHIEFGLVPLSPRSSLLREVGVEVDVQLPEPGCGDETDESGSCATTEEGSKDDKSAKSFCERARSLSAALPSLNVSSLSKVGVSERSAETVLT
ncbi:hypothetical protein FS749_007533 [Ceratobasidium sp. UAMH 11750]|nr:hypothetical protein FS749_007533 [Ceratobasidium sp. UAMH 11750]